MKLAINYDTVVAVIEGKHVRITIRASNLQKEVINQQDVFEYAYEAAEDLFNITITIAPVIKDAGMKALFVIDEDDDDE